MDANSRREEFKEKLMGRLPNPSLKSVYGFFHLIERYGNALQSLIDDKECTIYKNCTECEKHLECLKEVFSNEEVILSILKEWRELPETFPVETPKAKIEMRRD